jgi:cytochrome c biogenesis protein CcmG/thiol:disulfide interchange protein DsbE
VTAAASGDPNPPAPHGSAVARWLTLPLALLLAACTAEVTPSAQPETASPFADCAALTKPPPSAPVPFAKMTGNALPEIELACFTGGATVKLTQLQGPAVVNLWASWCEPCRSELPAMQELADHAAGRLTVVGVDTGDDRDSAASFGADHKVAMPTLYDREKRLIGKLGRSTLPVTIFLGDNGSWHVEPLPLDDTKLDELVRTWTGVTVKS